MAKYLNNSSYDASIGLPLREVAPTVQTGRFLHQFAPAPTDEFWITPGDELEQLTNEPEWVIHTRSTAFWEIIVESAVGATLIIHVGTRQGIGDTLDIFPWKAFTLKGEYVTNGTSGLELPGATFARFSIVSAEETAGAWTVSGQMMVRSV